MSIINSILVALIVMSIVFVVLAVLSLLIKIQSSIVTSINSRNSNTAGKEVAYNNDDSSQSHTLEVSAGDLTLIGVDEETAAMVMAIACDELKIPLNELQFKSIRALD